MPNFSMPFGAELLDDGGGVRFRLWAPDVQALRLQLEGAGRGRLLPMHALDEGWHEITVQEAGAGTRYRFMLPDGMSVPDPASRFNPEDVHGPSEVVDPGGYRWNDSGWRGRPWHEAVLYELHVGTFTEAGTYAAAMARLPELVALGITAVELMPLADFPGTRGWGYDGVLPFAPDARYGRPEELKRFVDEAHRLGLMVFLDVVYNHFGPEGNYLHAYCKAFFNAAHQTPWGAAINFDGAHSGNVRQFFIANALYWIEEYHFDGLRLDAVHAIADDSPTHIAVDIARALRAGPGRFRPVHVVLENDANAARLLARGEDGTPGGAVAQWNDDFHHAAHVLATGQRDGYYADYAADPVNTLGRCLAEGFAYQGDPSPFREGEPRGEPSAQLPSPAFVSFLQNHDQIGNRAFGERLSDLAPAARLDALYACLLLSPHVPMLFMGEELAATAPFLYFCDFGPELAAAVSKGRREEFGRFDAFQSEAARAGIPDPNAEATFTVCRPNWAEREIEPHSRRLALIQHLLELRRQWITPRLAGMAAGGKHRVEGGLLQVVWWLGEGATLRLAANFGEAPQPRPPLAGHIVFELHAEDAQLLPDGVIVSVEGVDV
ncbi:malto-oligosyltrehalose trehalohydrolase [Azohydromonas lata]|uniref:Malto-oligosyltrehalose trehalohydrolase n=1 Tax=Azohydromonas lata TaxID=45677 RepID=A0ABU5IIN1_9BURK|nr:malto-oligosyltrehalose trehalohydrolase [Azohydromonas lata]MDZ5458421.1 malto-oligosyltrehalose trehalohydrolase [Azohydromonas lata]